MNRVHFDNLSTYILMTHQTLTYGKKFITEAKKK